MHLCCSVCFCPGSDACWAQRLSLPAGRSCCYHRFLRAKTLNCLEEEDLKPTFMSRLEPPCLQGGDKRTPERCCTPKVSFGSSRVVVILAICASLSVLLPGCGARFPPHSLNWLEMGTQSRLRGDAGGTGGSKAAAGGQPLAIACYFCHPEAEEERGVGTTRVQPLCKEEFVSFVNERECKNITGLF